jgi:hypothetical protein
MLIKQKIVKTMGILLIVTIGIIHVLDAKDSFQDAVYKGWLFYANGLGALLTAYLIFKVNNKNGWNLGLLIAASSILGYISSRTIGLPLIPAEPDAWFEPLGIAAMIAEMLFITVYLIHQFAE